MIYSILHRLGPSAAIGLAQEHFGFGSTEPQEVLMAISFGSLFCLMLLYWGQAAFFSYTKYSKLTTVLLSFSFISLTALLIGRWVESGHFPLSNLYESLLFLSWSFLGIQLVAQFTLGTGVAESNLLSENESETIKIQDGDLWTNLLNLLSVNTNILRKKVSLSPFQQNQTQSTPTFINSNQSNVGNESKTKVNHLRGDRVWVPELSLTSPSETRLLATELQECNQTNSAALGLVQPKRVSISSQQQLLHLLGVITSPMALLIYGFAFLNLPREMQKATALVPALQSNWLMMHVTIMILSYATLLCGSIFSMVFLLLTSFNISSRSFWVRPKDEPSNTLQTLSKTSDRVPLHNKITETRLITGVVANEKTLPEQSSGYPTNLRLVRRGFKESREALNIQNLVVHEARVKSPELIKQKDSYFAETQDLSLADRLDNYSYRVLALGFPLLTVGILSGAVWANEAWGSYWSWDPKETWALITWLVFAIYLHARILKGWTGRKPAIIATFGFFVVWFCYLGVNLLGTGLHSYGWFSDFQNSLNP